jgi:hypothetical protein
MLGILCAFPSQGLQRAAQGDDLVEHVTDSLPMFEGRLECTETLKIGEESKPDLRSHNGDLRYVHPTVVGHVDHSSAE